MSDPLPPPITHQSFEPVQSADHVVVTYGVRGVKIRCLFGRGQIEHAAMMFRSIAMQMDEAAKISAAG